jgi:hypothetical protein
MTICRRPPVIPLVEYFVVDVPFPVLDRTDDDDVALNDR